MKTLRATVAAMALGLLATGAGAQSVWRCDDAGRVLYQDGPCPGGRSVEPAPAQPPGAAAEGARVAARERALAQQLAAERRQRDAQPVALAAGILNPPSPLSPPAKPAARKKRPPPPDADARTSRAAAPSSRRTPG